VSSLALPQLLAIIVLKQHFRGGNTRSVDFLGNHFYVDSAAASSCGGFEA